MAFQLYEHEDMLGLAIDEHVLLRTLKVSSCSFSLREPRGRGGGLRYKKDGGARHLVRSFSTS